MRTLYLTILGLGVSLFTGCKPALTCGDGTRSEGGRCLPTTTLSCGSGTRAQDGQCVPEATLSCGAGTHAESGTCVPDSTVTCGANTKLEGDACVPAFDCPAGTHLEGEACVKDAVPSTWTANVRISPEGAHASTPSIAADATGRAWIAYTQFAGQTLSIEVYASRDGGATWTASGSFTGSNYYMANPSIATTGDGKVYLAFTDFKPGGQNSYPADILFVRSDDEGKTWSAPIKLSSEDGGLYNDKARLAVGPGGSLHAHFFAEVATNDYRTLYRTSSDGGQVWSAAQPLPAAPSVPNDYAYATNDTAAAVTPDGTLIIPEVVHGYYTASRTVGFVSLAPGATAFDRTQHKTLAAGRSFEVNGQPLFASSSTGRNCFAFVNAPSRDFGIYLTSADATLTFGKANRVDDGVGSAQLEPGLAADAEGNCHLSWFDNRSGEWEVWAATVKPDGTVSANERVSDASFIEDGSYKTSLSGAVVLSIPATTRFAAWADARDGQSAIYASTSPITGP